MYTHKETAYLSDLLLQAMLVQLLTKILCEVPFTFVIPTLSSPEEGLTYQAVGSNSIHWHSMVVQSLLMLKLCQGYCATLRPWLLHHARNP